MHPYSMSSMPYPLFYFSTFIRPPLVTTPFTRTPLSSTLDVCSSPSPSLHLPATAFHCTSVQPTFLRVLIFSILSRDLMLLVARKDVSRVYIVLFNYLVVLYALMIIGNIRFVYYLVLVSLYRLCE